MNPKKKGPPFNPEEDFPLKPDKDPDKTEHDGDDPEKSDPTRIEDPTKIDPTRIDDPEPTKPEKPKINPLDKIKANK